MPKQDKTGPMGIGPRTGRGYGPCGFGLGLGQRCFGRWSCPLNNKNQTETLIEYKKALEKELDDVQEELNDKK